MKHLLANKQPSGAHDTAVVVFEGKERVHGSDEEREAIARTADYVLGGAANVIGALVDDQLDRHGEFSLDELGSDTVGHLAFALHQQRDIPFVRGCREVAIRDFYRATQDAPDKGAFFLVVNSHFAQVVPHTFLEPGDAYAAALELLRESPLLWDTLFVYDPMKHAIVHHLTVLRGGKGDGTAFTETRRIRVDGRTVEQFVAGTMAEPQAEPGDDAGDA